MKKIVFLIVFIVLFSCGEDDNEAPVSRVSEVAKCGDFIKLDESFMSSEEKFDIKSISVSGDCMEVEVEALGCDGESWQLDLYTTSAYVKSNPPQRTIRMNFRNNEDCVTQLSKKFEFDLSKTQIVNYRGVNFKIDNFPKFSINYKYEEIISEIEGSWGLKEIICFCFPRNVVGGDQKWIFDTQTMKLKVDNNLETKVKPILDDGIYTFKVYHVNFVVGSDLAIRNKLEVGNTWFYYYIDDEGQLVLDEKGAIAYDGGALYTFEK